MAVVPEAYLNSDFNEDDFDDYNQYPYKGGYDIVLTYGDPLPPSPAICYPVGGSTSSNSNNTVPSSTNNSSVPSPSQGSKDSKTKETEWRDYVPGNWSSARDYCGRCGDGGHSGWNFTQWAADFLFGYLPAYGEKRDETHNYGNLNYAYERHSFQQPVTCVEQQPEAFFAWSSSSSSSTQKMSDEDPNWYDGDIIQMTEHVSSYQTKSYDNSSITVQVEPPDWEGELSYLKHEGWEGGGGEDYPLMDHVYNGISDVASWTEDHLNSYETRGGEMSAVSIKVAPAWYEDQEEAYPPALEYNSWWYDDNIGYYGYDGEEQISIDVDSTERQAFSNATKYEYSESDARIETFEPAWSRDFRYNEDYQYDYEGSKHECGGMATYWPFQY